MFEPLNAGHPSLLSFSIRFLVNSIFCALVIYLSFLNKHLRSDFRYFFGNLAICDFLYSLSAYLYRFLSLSTKVSDNIFSHTLFSQLPTSFALSMLFAMTLTSFHRYMLIYKNNGEFFTKRRIAYMFILSSGTYFVACHHTQYENVCKKEFINYMGSLHIFISLPARFHCSHWDVSDYTALLLCSFLGILP